MSLLTIEDDFDYITSFQKVPKEQLPSWFLPERTRILTRKEDQEKDFQFNKKQPIVYWMQRDMRTLDNMALLLAQELAILHKVELHVVHVLLPPPKSNSIDESSLPPLHEMPITQRHGQFYLGGLEKVHNQLQKQNKFDITITI